MTGDDEESEGEIQEDNPDEAAAGQFKKHYVAPLGIYRLKDMVMNVVENKAFIDTVLVIIAFGAIIGALPFYPWPIALLLFIVLFVATQYHPFLGMILLMVVAFPVLMYQMPLLAWIFLIAVSLGLVFGYMHYRTILFMFILVFLSFSALGYLLVIPLFTFMVLIVGRKRALVVSVLFVLSVVVLSALTDVQNTAYIIYNAQAAHGAISGGSFYSYMVPNKTAPTIFNFGGALASAVGTFESSGTSFGIGPAVRAGIASLAVNPLPYIAEMVALLIIVLAIDGYVVTSRARYKGAYCGIVAGGYPLAYATAASYIYGTVPLWPLIASAALIEPLTAYIMEYYGIDFIKALEVKKNDIRMKFGDAFEDLQAGSGLEKFSNIANYESTKQELKDAIMSPIEQKGVSRAYNITPAKGLLFFGPPGTGKTLMMRALANEIHAAFFYVKSSDLISGYPGETEKKISNIFAIAKKNHPCILFFDEVDSIAMSRQRANADQSREHALSQLLIELDGFQKLEKVIFVGATNVPDVLDPALLRAGRIDRIIYMPLPALSGRKKIFEMYLKKYPLADDVDTRALAEKTQRYSGADIKNVCNTVAQTVAEDAAKEHKVLSITNEDILAAVKMTKPSASLSQLEMYNKFKLDFQRSIHGESVDSQVEKTSLEDVVGMEAAKKALVDAVQIPLLHPDLLKRYKIKTVRGVLMFGPPGNGKTMLMKAALSDDSLRGVNMLEINGSELVKEGLDKANMTLKEIFDRARENSPAVIFIDELDGLAPSRSTDDWIRSEITTELLKQMDGIGKDYSIVVVAATNRPEVLDDAILRPGRFDKLVFVKPPETEDRILLFKKYLEGVPLGSVDFAEIAKRTEGYTGADIANACREIKTAVLEKAIKEEKEIPVTTQDITAVTGSLKPSATARIMKEYDGFLEKHGQR